MASFGHAFYNLYLHPLRHFPGPRLYASSRLPYAVGLCRGTINKTVAEAHKKYGEVVRIAPDELSFISADTAWSDIYGFRGAKRPEFGKDPLWYPTQPNGVRSLLSSTREDHSRIRRVFSQGFSDKALRNQESLIRGYIDKLMARLLEKRNTPVDLVRYFNYTTFDIIADLTFGESFGCLDSDDYHDFIPAILGALRVVNILQAINYYRTINKIASVFLALLSKISTPVHILFHNFVAGKVDKRLAMEMQRPDFITAVMNQTEEKGGLTEEELKSNSVLFLIAGSETTATMMSGTTFALLKHPEAMKKLCYEIRTVFHSEEEITFESASHLPYLQAVIHEGLRMYPPVPTGFARRVPKNGETVSGYYLPENVSSNSLPNLLIDRHFHLANIHQDLCLCFPIRCLSRYTKLYEPRPVYPGEMA